MRSDGGSGWVGMEGGNKYLKDISQIVSVGHIDLLGWGGGGWERKKSRMDSGWIPI